MKKFLDIVLLGASTLFAILIFPLMAAPGLKETILDRTVSVYKAMEEAPVFLVAFIFMILVLLASLLLCTLKLLNGLKITKFELPLDHFVAAGAALFALVAGILYFFGEPSYLDGETSEYMHLGAGAVICAILALLAALCLCAYAAKKFLKK